MDELPKLPGLRVFMNALSVLYMSGGIFSIHALCESKCSSFVCGATAATTTCVGGALFGPTLFWTMVGMNGIALASRALKRARHFELERRIEESFRNTLRDAERAAVVTPYNGIPYGIRAGNEFVRRSRLEFQGPSGQLAG